MPQKYDPKDPREKDNPMGLESIKTLVDLEKKQRSWSRSKAARDDLIASASR